MAKKDEKVTNVENVEEKVETTQSNIDMQKLISEAIKNAVSETSKAYELRISELEQKIQEKESENSLEKEEVVSKHISMNSDKMVAIQHMGIGNASFHRGRVRVNFEKLFDVRKIQWSILDEMYYEFQRWFEEFEIVILDKEVREYYGLEGIFKEEGADEKVFNKLLDMNNDNMLNKVNKFPFMLSMSFLKFYCLENMRGNQKAFVDNRYQIIQDFYAKKYSIPNLNEIINELREFENNK